MIAGALKIAAVALAAICLPGLFSTEAADSDFWWHLKTGQFIVERHALPLPDPFSYTTALNPPATPGEAHAQRFNLTHEWLAQALLYVVYAFGGIPLVVLSRAAILSGMCALGGLLAARLSGSFYAGIAAAFASAAVAIEFRADRPALLSFLFAAVFVTLLELRIALWALPVLTLLWANSHGGFILAWVVLGAYSFDAFWRADRRKIWLISACSIAISFLNPNGFGVLPAIIQYRRSEMQSNLFEWHRPPLWGPPYAFDVLLYASALILLIAWRRVRIAHWALYAAFATLSIMAFRNIALIGFLAPVLIAAYVPKIRAVPGLLRDVVAWGAPVLLLAALAAGVASGQFFQLRAAAWKFPLGAGDFILANHIDVPMFNTYGQGGYWIWKLWPHERVFIDGRALSEASYRDYIHILYNPDSAADQLSGPRTAAIDHYGVRLVATNTFEFNSGEMLPLGLALSRADSREWSLVYDDARELIFMRDPPPGMKSLDDKQNRVLDHMDAECSAHIDHAPETPNCAWTLYDFWMRSGRADRARPMLKLYVTRALHPDPRALEEWRKLGG